MTIQDPTTLIRCPRCSTEKPPADFYRDKSRKNGHQYACKICTSGVSRAWKKAHPERTREYQRAYYQRNRGELNNQTAQYKDDYPERAAARLAIHKAIADGDLARGPCFVYGGEPADGHHEDYSKPYEIIWLCRICHTTYHRFIEEERS